MFYIKNHGGYADSWHMVKPAGEPSGAVATTNPHALVVPNYRSGKAKPARLPLDTVTGIDRFAVVTGSPVQVADCPCRMVQPRESLRAQRFPDTVNGNQGEQTMQAGNAVSANVAQWLAEQITAALDTRPPTPPTAPDR